MLAEGRVGTGASASVVQLTWSKNPPDECLPEESCSAQNSAPPPVVWHDYQFSQTTIMFPRVILINVLIA